MSSIEAAQPSLFLVEDNPGDVFLVKTAIQEEGLSFDLKIAEDGEKAIRMIDDLDERGEGQVPTLMLLDMNVPRKTGIQVLERLRQSERCSKVPVVMISSSDSIGERQRAFGLGATEYFLKPSTLADFLLLGKLVRRLHEQACGTA